ncbi:MAG TPA: enterobactin transporter EntS [Gemmatimonas aurantiaca]|uniref:Siderophore export protein n=2 Tax=Gemmatimonas aurantiaca TaxID=173480 RepID=C1ACN9_GEMAT|nr:enterobactin transporter EntS [Gemmatimonas aurantiaca]BAH40266.1 siderophore export protein [Gemmatimonas aurantiaca T-27]HCT57724.1 enterobactin transporter EntS [Gemmatimonas aurantiaca]
MTAPASGLLLDVTPLRTSRDFRLLFAARTISIVSIGVISVAVGWQVFEITGSSWHVGLVNLCLAVPMTMGLMVGGVMADRFDRRRLIVSSRSVYVLVAALFLINTLLPQPQLWIIYLASTIAGAINGISAPALMAAMPSLVQRAQLAAAGALITVSSQAGAMLGPSLAGITIGAWGLTACYVIVAVGAILTPLLLSRMQPLPAGPGVPLGPIAAARESWHFTRTHHVVGALLLLEIPVALFASPGSLFPELASSRFAGASLPWSSRLMDGAIVAGWLYSAPAAGAFLSSLLSGWTGRTRDAGAMLVLTTVLWAVGTIGLGVASTALAAVIALTVAGAGRALSEILRRALLQSHTPDGLQGRVGSLWLIQAVVLPSLGMALAGAAAQWLPPHRVVTVSGCLALIGTVVIVLAFPALRREGQPS